MFASKKSIENVVVGFSTEGTLYRWPKLSIYRSSLTVSNSGNKKKQRAILI